MKRVAIFGGSGFLGSYVADELHRRGYDITIVDKVQSKFVQQYKFVEVDILDFQSIREIVKDMDYIYNFVAVSNLDDAIHMPITTMNINVMGNMNILEACRETGNIERFIYASSAYALSEEGSFYGISKRTSEKIIEEYSKRYGLKYTIIRYGSVYGERESHNNYIYNLIKNGLETGVLEYKGNGEDIREYIHAKDVAKLSVDILENREFENQHLILTGIERMKRIELLTMINEILGNKLKIENVDENHFGHYKITPYSFQPTTAKKLVANPFIDLGQGILEVIQTIAEKR
ncbi:MAG TPA: NAD(P)-dependent oxidoreductase [Campylobacterales bacterium]|nr:NAD(P)-dependent oxidoreductase [Campylobacterales bacterium]